MRIVYARRAHEENKKIKDSSWVTEWAGDRSSAFQRAKRENGFHRGIPLAFFFFFFLHAPQPSEREREREKQLISPLKDVNLFRPQLGSLLSLCFGWIQTNCGGSSFHLLYLVDSNLFGDSSDFVSCEWKSAFPSSSFQSIGQINCWLSNESTKMVKKPNHLFRRWESLFIVRALSIFPSAPFRSPSLPSLYHPFRQKKQQH